MSALPLGYKVRRDYPRGLALDVKVHRAATAAEVAEVAAELDAAPAAFAAWLAEDRDRDGELQGFATSYAFDLAEERARELFGAGARVFQDGRSGGWLVLEVPGVDADAVLTTLDRVAQYGGEGVKLDESEAQELAEARELLAALETFATDCREAVANFPRTVAWYLCANGYLPALEAEAAENRRRGAEARLAAATAELRRVAGSDAVAGDLPERTLAPLRAAVAEYDAALGGAE